MGRKKAKKLFLKRYKSEKVAFKYLVDAKDSQELNDRKGDLIDNAIPEISGRAFMLSLNATLYKAYSRLAWQGG